MFLHRKLYCKETDRTEVTRRSLVTLAVQLLVLELGRALLARPLVLLAVDLLAVDAAVFDEEAGRAVLELDGIAPFLAAVGAGFFDRVDRDTAHAESWDVGDTVYVKAGRLRVAEPVVELVDGRKDCE